MLFKNLINYFSSNSIEVINGNAFVSDFVIPSVHFNSSLISNGSLFIALTGGNRDGHLFINSAIENGAKFILLSDKQFIPSDNKGVVFILVEDTLSSLQSLASYYRSDVLQAKVIAVTGSNGKTTTKDILFNLLSYKHKTHKTIGNLNNHIGLPISILNAPIDTEFLILELGMNHFGEIELLSSISKPNYAIITSIGESHIEYLGSRLGIAKAKSEIAYNFKSDEILFLPRDCDLIEDLITLNSFLKDHQIIPFGSVECLNMPFIQRYKNISYESCGNKEFLKEKFYVDFLDGLVTLPLVGIHNINNALPCLYIAYINGLSLDEINSALEKLTITSMRFELVNSNKDYTLINDAYNASPSSMKANIKTFLPAFSDKKRILVLGDMFELGEDTYELHEEVGEFLNSFNNEISFLVTVGNYSAKLSSAFKGKKRHFESVFEAGEWLKTFDNEEFALFFKASRGMKLEEIIKQLVK